MSRHAWLAVFGGCAALMTGCLEQKYVVYSDPPGATVFVNGHDIGAAPTDNHFTYYGDYDVTVVKDGFATLHAVQNIRPRWYNYPPFDFVVETLLPWTIQDVRVFTYTLDPLTTPRTDELLNRAETLRGQARSLGSQTTGDEARGQP